jgi:hypothetical protein
MGLARWFEFGPIVVAWFVVVAVNGIGLVSILLMANLVMAKNSP